MKEVKITQGDEPSITVRDGIKWVVIKQPDTFNIGADIITVKKEKLSELIEILQSLQ